MRSIRTIWVMDAPEKTTLHFGQIAPPRARTPRTLRSRRHCRLSGALNLYRARENSGRLIRERIMSKLSHAEITPSLWPAVALARQFTKSRTQCAHSAPNRAAPDFFRPRRFIFRASFISLRVFFHVSLETF